MLCRASAALPRQCSSAAQIAPPTPQTGRPSDTLRGKAAPTRQGTTTHAAKQPLEPPTTRPEIPHPYWAGTPATNGPSRTRYSLPDMSG